MSHTMDYEPLPSSWVIEEARAFLNDLYSAIPDALASRIRLISQSIAPGFDLEKWLRVSSNLFVGTRYPYEAGSVQAVDVDVLKLAPHLDLVLVEMTRSVDARSR